MVSKVKIPGASVRNQPLRDTQGGVIGKILDVVYSPDHRAIEHGVIELDRNGSGKKQVDLSWDAVEFDEKGRASLKYEIGEEPLAPDLKSKRKTHGTDNAAPDVDFFTGQLAPK